MCAMMIIRPILILSQQIHTDMSLTFKCDFLNTCLIMRQSVLFFNNGAIVRLQTIHCLQNDFGAHNKQKADKGHDTKFTCNLLACFRGACRLHLQSNYGEQVAGRTDHTT